MNQNKVPIIQYDSLIYLLTIIRLKKVTRILEIGTAIAYSSLQMANMSDDIVIDTIERDDEMYDIAKTNVEKICFFIRHVIVLMYNITTNVGDKLFS